MSPQNSVDGTEQQRDGSSTRTELEPHSGFNLEARPSGNEPTPPNGGLVLGGGKTIKLMLVPDNAGAPSPPPKKKDKPHPQTKMTKFWANFDPEYVGKVTRVLPERMTDKNLSLAQLVGEIAHCASNSYDNAKETCIRDVKRIIKECRDANQKYTDSHFDIERDLKITRIRDCLDGLVVDPSDKEYPADVKRVTDIYDEPKFYVDGVSYDDILQGSAGDCWFLAAISSLGCNQQFIDRVCVVHDQAVGVYGFVFNRDGDWHHCIIDDKLFLRAPNYDESGDVVLGQYGLRRANQEDQYQQLFQRGSQALYFAQCRDQNETWVSLLEKAYAKAHGDYASISGGQTGEAIEDLTGGVTTEIYTTNILDIDAFWKNELSRIGKDFVFSCAAARWREWRPYLLMNEKVREERRSGIVSQHAYAVLDTYEGHGQRLVKVRNPWGRKEWTGAWSDGSKEWTAEWLERLHHSFDDDGIFWLAYSDLLSKYKYIDRTRIFGPEWHVAQQWVSVQVPWSTLDYQTNHFSIDVPEDTEAVIVLSQLDDRYFKGLQGKYNFTLQFRVQKDSDDEEEYIARSKLNYELVRSVNVEVQLAKGTYSVLVKVEAVSTGRDDVEKVIRNNIHRRDKITQIGKLYDLAHQKGQLPGTTVPGSSGTSTPSAVGARTPPAPASVAQASTTSSDGDGNGKDDSADDPERDPNRNPWNASCVVGLRVYSKQPELGLKVVVPTKDEIIENKPTLDRDDVAKSALDEVQVLADKVDEITGSIKGDDDDGGPAAVGELLAANARNEAHAQALTAPGKEKKTQRPVESDEDDEESDDESAASYDD
ncbi:calpain-3 [Exophiala viscosa]|uniref:calpain-3 n=1 Tax=Exophiala viscosa TaxID=2486360 RepID=UPI002194027F|nr:calpain-3 [Exophiala viscosa]